MYIPKKQKQKKLVHEFCSRVIHNSKELETNPTDEWINKRWPIHTLGYYSAIRRNEALLYATT